MNRPHTLELLLPLPALPLLLLLLLVLPLFILAGESLVTPVIDSIKALLMPINSGVSFTGIPVQLVVKLLVFLVFTFTGVAMLMLKLSCVYHDVWSRALGQAHASHAPYHADAQESMVALLNWNLYRWFRILSPLLGSVGLVILVGAFLLWFTNTFPDLPILNFNVQFTIGMFVMLTLGFFTVLAFFKTLGRGFQSILGDVAAITEPDKPTQVLFERAQKLAFVSGWSWLLYPLYFLFYVALFAEIGALVWGVDVGDVLSLNPDILGPVLVCEAATLVIFLMLSGLKMLTYHDALGRFYREHWSYGR